MPVETRLDTQRATELEKAFLEHHEMVYRAAFRITGNASDAEDVLQTLFLDCSAANGPPTISRDGRHTCIARRSTLHDIVRTRTRQAPLGETEFELQENRPDAHREHSANELRDWVTKELAQMKPAWAEMFVLRRRRMRCSRCREDARRIKGRSPSHCFGYAAVSRNQFASFWEDADMDANHKNPKKRSMRRSEPRGPQNPTGWTWKTAQLECGLGSETS